jgi:hypothetical protein
MTTHSFLWHTRQSKIDSKCMHSKLFNITPLATNVHSMRMRHVVIVQ